MKNNQCGSALAAMLIGVFMFCLVIIPIFGFLFDMARVYVIANDVKDAIDSAVLESYLNMNKTSMSKGTFAISSTGFASDFNDYLQFSLELNEDLTPMNSSSLDGPLSVNSLNFFGTDSLPYTDSDTGKIYNRPFIEVDYTVRFVPIFNRTAILSAIGNLYSEVEIKRKVSLPVNN